MKNITKTLLSLLFIFNIIYVNAATFTISNNSECSDKTIYQTFSSKTSIPISSTYTYSEKGLYIENGSVDKNSHKDIDLANSYGTVQIIKTTTIYKTKNAPNLVNEYFLTQHKSCNIIGNKKTCYDLPPGISNSIAIVCNNNNLPPPTKAEMEKGLKDGTITVGGTPMTPIYQSNN